MTTVAETDRAAFFATIRMSETLTHELAAASDTVHLTQSIARALHNATTDAPDQKPDPGKVNALSARTLDSWRHYHFVKNDYRTVGASSPQETAIKDIERSLEPDDPVRLQRIAESATQVVAAMLYVHTQAILNSRPTPTP